MGDEALVARLSRAQRRALGCYLTPEPLARLMARRIVHLVEAGGVVVDPAAGTGRLLRAVAELTSGSDEPPTGPRLIGVERVPELAAWAREHVAGARVVDADALDLLDSGRRLEHLGVAEVDAVIANPPYVREKHHRRVLAAAALRDERWRRFRAPRGDLQQLFLALGVELLRPGGELVYLVNSYWLQSDSARALREHLRARVDVLSIVDFGRLALFDDAPGQHGLLLHARRRAEGRRAGESTAEPTVRADPFFVRVTDESPRAVEEVAEGLDRAFSGGPAPSWLRLTRDPGPVVVGPTHRWYLPDGVDAALAALERGAPRLGELFRTHQGVVSGADQVTRRNRVWLERDPPPVGAGIFVLSSDEVEALGLSALERRLLKRVYRARDVRPFAIKPSAWWWLLDLRDGVAFEECPAVGRHLERFRPLLERRREVRRGRMPWWRLHWPRDPELFERPRLVTPRRATRPRFALAPEDACEQSDLALITDPDDDDRRLGALLVVLNSPAAARWFRYRGKHKGRVREFFGAPLEELPLPAAARDDPPAFRALAELADPERRGEIGPAVQRLYEARSARKGAKRPRPPSQS